MFTITDRMGQLLADGIATQTPMSKWVDLHTLKDFGDLVGDDTRVAGGGFVTNPRRFDGLTRTLHGVMAGDVNQDGTTWDDNVDGWLENQDWFQGNITNPPTNADQTKALVLNWQGKTYTALGRIGPLVAGDLLGDGLIRIACDVSLPIAPFVRVS